MTVKIVKVRSLTTSPCASYSNTVDDGYFRYVTVDDDARNMFLGTAASLARILHCNVLDLYPDEHVWRGGVSAGVVGLRNIRLFRGLTQTQLAGMSGVARPNISWFETGYRPVSQMYLRTALRLSEALQCDPVDFLTEGY